MEVPFRVRLGGALDPVGRGPVVQAPTEGIATEQAERESQRETTQPTG